MVLATVAFCLFLTACCSGVFAGGALLGEARSPAMCS